MGSGHTEKLPHSKENNQQSINRLDDERKCLQATIVRGYL